MTTLAMWAVQDHAVDLIRTARAVAGSPLQLAVVDLGEPGNIEADHVWLSEEVTDWEREASSTTHDDEIFNLRLHVYCQVTTGDYLVVRERVAPMLEAAIDALTPSAWVGAIGCVYSVRIRRGQVEGSIVSDTPITRAALATVWLEVRCIVDHPLGG